MDNHLPLSSALALPSLETIPGSRDTTPAPQWRDSSPRPDGMTPSSSRSGYFTAHDTPHPATASNSPATTPGDRLKPSPIIIPEGTTEKPLFSAYPLSRGNSITHGKDRTFNFSLQPAFTLTSPPRRRRGSINEDDTSDSASSTARQTSAPRSLPGSARAESARGTRRRALSVVERADSSISAPPFVFPHTLKFHHRRRRASLGSGDFEPSTWRNMESSVASQFESHLPFSYQPEQGQSEYSLESVSAVTSVRPLSSPVISQRNSSLVNQGTSIYLGLTNLSISQSDVIATDDIPPRRSSLTYDNILEMKIKRPVSAGGTSLHSDHSTFSSSNDPSLPSTKTSLSRSARSGKEGPVEDLVESNDEQMDISFLDKHRMILLEIVETEVTYVDDLRTLVHIYLPQLAALPQVTERTHVLIRRNTKDLLEFHGRFAAQMVHILKINGIGYDRGSDAASIGMVTRQMADLFVREVSSFSLYNEYCAGSIAAASLVRMIAIRPEFESFEKRCQFISSSAPSASLRDLLSEQTSSPVRSRLRFKDFLITPIQRVCRYPLLLAALLSDVHRDLALSDIITAVQKAQVTMRSVAENADDARRQKEAEIKTATIVERIETHPILTNEFIRRLGTCRLIGALDVLHHHPVLAPLVPPVKVKYLAAFLYRGYLILAKAKKNKCYEAKHYLPLEVFELIDVTEGFLPHSIRLTLRDHNFDLAASCDSEKSLWAAELCAARDESTVPPFELPASVSPFAPRSRRMSNIVPTDYSPVSPTATRHSVLSAEIIRTPEETPESPTAATAESLEQSVPLSLAPSPAYRRIQPATLLLRRASVSQRLNIDRSLADVYSEALSTARSKAQMRHALFLPSAVDARRLSLRDATMLRRRRSFLDSRLSSIDVVSTAEIRGCIMPLRQATSAAGQTTSAGQRRSLFVQDFSVDTAADSGSLHNDLSRNSSTTSIMDMPTRSTLSNRRSVDVPLRSDPLSRRKTASTSNLTGRTRETTRARSMPASPAAASSVALNMPRTSAVAEQMRIGYFERALIDSWPSESSPPTSTTRQVLHRSISFFSRRGSFLPDQDDNIVDIVEDVVEDDIDDMVPVAEANEVSDTLSTPPNQTPSSTPDTTPQNTPKRKRSARLFGQLRGFTPI